MLHDNQSVVLQFAVGGCNRVQVHSKVSRKLSYRRQRSTLYQFTSRNQLLDPIGNLPIDRPRIVGIYGQQHCLVYVYSIHFSRVKGGNESDLSGGSSANVQQRPGGLFRAQAGIWSFDGCKRAVTGTT
jgi:hypothetical protein